MSDGQTPGYTPDPHSARDLDGMFRELTDVFKYPSDTAPTATGEDDVDEEETGGERVSEAAGAESDGNISSDDSDATSDSGDDDLPDDENGEEAAGPGGAVVCKCAVQCSEKLPRDIWAGLRTAHTSVPCHERRDIAKTALIAGAPRPQAPAADGQPSTKRTRTGFVYLVHQVEVCSTFFMFVFNVKSRRLFDIRKEIEAHTYGPSKKPQRAKRGPRPNSARTILFLVAFFEEHGLLSSFPLPLQVGRNSTGVFGGFFYKKKDAGPGGPS
jgi:hypothetical protein